MHGATASGTPEPLDRHHAALRALVIGVGQRYRGDDAVGLEVAARVRARCLPGVRVLDSDGDLTDLVDRWNGEETVVVVDAMKSGARPGSIRRFDPSDGPLPRSSPGSSHAIGVSEAVELARALGRLPLRLRVIGIEALGVEYGMPLSEECAAAVEAAVAAVLEEATCTN